MFRGTPKLGSVVILGALLISGCHGKETSAPAAGSGNAALDQIAAGVLEDTYRRYPTQATYLGIHKYDQNLEDYSRQAVADTIDAARKLRSRVEAIDPASLSLDKQLDREQLLHALDSRILTLDVIRPWAKDPD